MKKKARRNYQSSIKPQGSVHILMYRVLETPSLQILGRMSRTNVDNFFSSTKFLVKGF